MSTLSEYDAFKKAIHSYALVWRKDQRMIFVQNGSYELPWVFDFRRLSLNGEWLNHFAQLFWERFNNEPAFQVGGMETAAIPLLAAIVLKGKELGKNVNGFYIRKSRDKDGLMKLIEGELTDLPVILVDDVLNSGASMRKQIKILEAEGKRVNAIFTIISFLPKESYRSFTHQKISVDSLFTLPDFGIEPPRIEKEQPWELFTTEWKYSAPNPSFEWVFQKSAPTLDADTLYFGTDNGTFYALEQKTGAIRWQFETGKHPTGKGIFSSPIVNNGVVYFGAYDGNVYALDAATGATKWINSDADWVGSSPALAPKLGLLYIGLEFGLWRKRGGIAAIDIASGKTKWRDQTAEFTHGSPLYIHDERLVVIGSNDSVVYAYDAKSGERKWTYRTNGEIKTSPLFDRKRRHILVPSRDGHLYALDAHGALKWKFRTDAPLYSIPFALEDTVYIASLDKSLYALDAATGELRWEFKTLGRIFASPMYADGSLWIGSNDGRLYEIDEKSGALKGSHQFSERIVNAIAYNPLTENFFVSTVANEIYALRRKEHTPHDIE